MQKPFFLFLSIFAAGPAFALELPMYLQEKLDKSAASTSFQLKVNDTIEKISKEKTYREVVQEEVNRDLHGWEKTADVAQWTSRVVGLAGMGTFAVGSTELPESSVSSNKAGITNESVMISGAAMSLGGLISTMAMSPVIKKEITKNVLNEEMADTYAATAASRLAGFFRLAKNKELALKFAIKEEIYRKNKEKDLTPMNLTEVIKSAKLAGNPVLSEKELSAFVQVQAELQKASGNKPQLTNEEKIGFLIGASAMLDTQVKVTKKAADGNSAELRKASEQTESNHKLLAEINEYRKNLGDKVEEKNKDPEESEHDAE